MRDDPAVNFGSDRATRPVRVLAAGGTIAMRGERVGFEGAERDLRASGAICVPFLSPAAARVALVCALGADLDGAGMQEALAPFDAQ